MKIVSLDVHTEASQVAVISERGEVVLEMKVPTDPKTLRELVAGIPGPKRVVFEQGPLAARLHDALKGCCEEVINSDPTRNALIARAEDSNDERDARRLATLAQVNAVRKVYVPPEPYRTLRNLLTYDNRLERTLTGTRNRIKGLYRRYGVAYRGRRVYGRRGREALIKELANPMVRWQAESLYRQFDLLIDERRNARRRLRRIAQGISVVSRMQAIPGVGPITAWTLVGWIADPTRFRTRSKLNSYAGLGLGQGFTNWKPVGRTRASKRGNRQIKRVLMIAAHIAGRGQSVLGHRYRTRIRAGWDPSKAQRDLAKAILRTAMVLWRKNSHYDGNHISPPPSQNEEDARRPLR